VSVTGRDRRVPTAVDGIDETDVSQAILDAYHAKFVQALRSDVIVVGATGANPPVAKPTPVKPVPTPKVTLPVVPNPVIKPVPATETVTVYVTRTGKKYHRGYCSNLRSSRIPVSLRDAKARRYGPCSRCGPPR